MEEDLEWLEENDPYLGRAVKAAVDSALDALADKPLELILLKEVLLVLWL